MRYKPGVTISGVLPPIWYALGVAEGVYDTYGEHLVVTSLTDGVHPDRKNVHGRGLAADLRTRNLAPDIVQRIRADLSWKLYALGYDVVFESNPPHLHIEFDPKVGRADWFPKEG